MKITPKQILEQARNLVCTPNRWTRGTMTLYPESDCPAYCISGAIHRAGKELLTNEGQRYQVVNEAMAHFYRANPGITRLQTWNDSPARRHEDVLEAFDRTLALLDVKEERREPCIFDVSMKSERNGAVAFLTYLSEGTFNRNSYVQLVKVEGQEHLSEPNRYSIWFYTATYEERSRVEDWLRETLPKGTCTGGGTSLVGGDTDRNLHLSIADVLSRIMAREGDPDGG